MAPTTNYDAMATAQQPVVSFADRESNRYLIFTGDLAHSTSSAHPAGGLDLGSPCIRPFAGGAGFLNRCLLTPMIKVAVRRIDAEIPDGTLIGNRIQSRDAFGRLTNYVDVPLYPGPEADNLVRLYGDWGLREVECLRGFNQTEVSAMRLNSFFFPQWPKLPDFSSDLIAHLEERFAAAKKAEGVNRLLPIIAEDYLKAANANHNWMFKFIEQTHGYMSLPENHLAFRAKYEDVDLHFLKRLNMQRRDKDLQTMVQTQELIGKVLADKGVTNNQGLSAEQFTDAMQKVLAANAQMMQQIMKQTMESAKKPENQEPPKGKPDDTE